MPVSKINICITKALTETELLEYYKNSGVRYLHSDIEILERVKIIR